MRGLQTSDGNLDRKKITLKEIQRVPNISSDRYILTSDLWNLDRKEAVTRVLQCFRIPGSL